VDSADRSVLPKRFSLMFSSRQFAATILISPPFKFQYLPLDLPLLTLTDCPSRVSIWPPSVR